MCCWCAELKQLHLVYFAQDKGQSIFPTQDRIEYRRTGQEEKGRPISYFSLAKKQNKTKMDKTPILLGVEDDEIQTVILHRLKYPTTWKHNTERFALVAHDMLDTMLRILCGAPPEHASIWIEEYTFHSYSQSESGLHEVSSIFKYWLWQRGYRFSTMSNSTAKKEWAGRGKADKFQMFLACKRRYPFVAARLAAHFLWDFAKHASKRKISDMPEEFAQSKNASKLLKLYQSGLFISAPPPAEDAPPTPVAKPEPEIVVPNPLQDLVDAIAICFVGKSGRVTSSIS